MDDLEVLAEINRVIQAQLHWGDSAIVTTESDLSVGGVGGFDSLDLLELAIALEEHFCIEISNDEADRALTGQQLVDLIKAKLAAKVSS